MRTLSNTLIQIMFDTASISGISTTRFFCYDLATFRKQSGISIVRKHIVAGL